MMDLSESNTNVKASTNYLKKSKFETTRLHLDEKNDPSTNLSYSFPNSSAPLLSPSLYDLTAPDIEPPSYSSVVAQDSGSWGNRLGSSFNKPRLCLTDINEDNSTSDLDNKPPYPTGNDLTKGALVMPMPIAAEKEIDVTPTVTKEPKSANFSFPAGGNGLPLTDIERHSVNDPLDLNNPTKSSKYSKSIPARHDQKAYDKVQQQFDTGGQKLTKSGDWFEWFPLCCECCLCGVELCLKFAE